MNNILILIGILTFALILWNLRISVNITKELKKHNIKAEISYRRGLIFKYLKIYRDITIKEEGKPGELYNQFIISFVSFSTLLIIGLILSAIIN